MIKNNQYNKGSNPDGVNVATNFSEDVTPDSESRNGLVKPGPGDQEDELDEEDDDDIDDIDSDYDEQEDYSDDDSEESVEESETSTSDEEELK